MKRIISFVIRKIPRKYLQVISPLALSVLGLFYAGNKVTCPISGRSYRKFLPYGRTNPRPNALCPDSLSLERHRLIWLYLKERTNFFTKKLHFLHIAPEQCFLQKFEQQHGEGYITADIESPLAKVKMDVHAIPFEDSTFDAAMCNHVMEHVEDDHKAMTEILRVLKPGGWAIIQIPIFHPLPEVTFEDKTIISPNDRLKYFGQEDHVRLYGKDYPNKLRAAGFIVREDDFVMQLPAETVAKYALPADEIIYFCQKADA